MLACIGTGFEPAFDRRLGQHIGISHQCIDRADSLVEIVLEGVEIAVVAVGDLWRDVALGDAIDITGSHIERANHGVQGLIDTGDDGLKVAFMLAGIGPRFELAGDRCPGQQRGIVNQAANRALNRFDGACDIADLVFGSGFDLEFEVATAHFFGSIHHLIDRNGDGAGDEPAQQDARQGGDACQYGHNLGGTAGHRIGLLADFLHLFVLMDDHVVNVLSVVLVKRTHIPHEQFAAFAAIAGPHQQVELVCLRGIERTAVNDPLQNCFAFVRPDRGGQLVKTGGNQLALLRDAVEFL